MKKKIIIIFTGVIFSTIVGFSQDELIKLKFVTIIKEINGYKNEDCDDRIRNHIEKRQFSRKITDLSECLDIEILNEDYRNFIKLEREKTNQDLALHLKKEMQERSETPDIYDGFIFFDFKYDLLNNKCTFSSTVESPISNKFSSIPLIEYHWSTFNSCGDDDEISKILEDPINKAFSKNKVRTIYQKIRNVKGKYPDNCFQKSEKRNPKESSDPKKKETEIDSKGGAQQIDTITPKPKSPEPTYQTSFSTSKKIHSQDSITALAYHNDVLISGSNSGELIYSIIKNNKIKKSVLIDKTRGSIISLYFCQNTGIIKVTYENRNSQTMDIIFYEKPNKTWKRKNSNTNNIGCKEKPNSYGLDSEIKKSIEAEISKKNIIMTTHTMDGNMLFIGTNFGSIKLYQIN